MKVEFLKVDERTIVSKELIKVKNGKYYTFYFSKGRDIRKVNSKIEKIGDDRLYVRTYYTNSDGCWGNSRYEQDIFNKELKYNTENILKALNVATEDQFSELVLLG